MAITFQNQDINFNLKDRLKIRTWIKKIIALEKKRVGEINYVFMDDAALLKKNIQYLKHDTYTDIITFDNCEGDLVSGDIMVSVDRVSENSKKFKVDFENELKRVIIHGILHLCGYSDKTKKGAELMRKKEDWALKKF